MHVMSAKMNIITLLKVVLFLVMKRMNLTEKILSTNVCMYSSVTEVLTIILSIKNVLRDLLLLSSLHLWMYLAPRSVKMGNPKRKSLRICVAQIAIRKTLIYLNQQPKLAIVTEETKQALQVKDHLTQVHHRAVEASLVLLERWLV